MKTKLKEDCTTRRSKANSKTLVAKHGIPLEVKIEGDPDQAIYRVTAMFRDGVEHTFRGFSLGYAGEGPRGLYEFLKDTCQMKINFDQISQVPRESGKYSLAAYPSRNKLVQSLVSEEFSP